MNELFSTLFKECKDINDFKYVLEKIDIDNLYLEPELVGEEEISRIRIFATDWFDVLLLKWSPNCVSPIHDHPDNGCYLKVLYGNLLETLYDKNVIKIGVTKLEKGMINYIHNNIGYHSIKNLNDDWSYTLHVYSPPYYKPNIISKVKDTVK